MKPVSGNQHSSDRHELQCFRPQGCCVPSVRPFSNKVVTSNIQTNVTACWEQQSQQSWAFYLTSWPEKVAWLHLANVSAVCTFIKPAGDKSCFSAPSLPSSWFVHIETLWFKEMFIVFIVSLHCGLHWTCEEWWGQGPWLEVINFMRWLYVHTYCIITRVLCESELS